jgi:hypothetical protein
MTIQPRDAFRRQIHELSQPQGRDVDAVVEEAIHRYPDDAAVTDVSSADVAATQEQLLRELDLPPWDDSEGQDTDAAR